MHQITNYDATYTTSANIAKINVKMVKILSTSEK